MQRHTMTIPSLLPIFWITDSLIAHIIAMNRQNMPTLGTCQGTQRVAAVFCLFFQPLRACSSQKLQFICQRHPDHRCRESILLWCHVQLSQQPILAKGTASFEQAKSKPKLSGSNRNCSFAIHRVNFIQPQHCQLGHHGFRLSLYACYVFTQNPRHNMYSLGFPHQGCLASSCLLSPPSHGVPQPDEHYIWIHLDTFGISWAKV